MRASGRSRPWSTALRIMCVKGSARRSITVRSTSAPSPSVFSRTFLPVASATSRTMRAMRWNSGRTGCARIAITLSWISRVRCSRSSRPVAMLAFLTAPASSTRCVNMAWLMTSSPIRLMSRSTRSRSTLIVFWLVLAPGSALTASGAASRALGAAAFGFSTDLPPSASGAVISTKGSGGGSCAASTPGSIFSMSRWQSPSTNSNTACTAPRS